MKIESITFGHQLENGTDLRSLGWDPELKSDRPTYALNVKCEGKSGHWSAILLSDSTDGALVPLLTTAPFMRASIVEMVNWLRENTGPTDTVHDALIRATAILIATGGKMLPNGEMS